MQEAVKQAINKQDGNDQNDDSVVRNTVTRTVQACAWFERPSIGCQTITGACSDVRRICIRCRGQNWRWNRDGRRIIIRNSPAVSGENKSVRTNITEVIMNRYEGDENKGQACGPFEQDEEDESAVGEGRDYGVQLGTGRRRGTRGETKKDNQQRQYVGKGK